MSAGSSKVVPSKVLSTRAIHDSVALQRGADVFSALIEQIQKELAEAKDRGAKLQSALLQSGLMFSEDDAQLALSAAQEAAIQISLTQDTPPSSVPDFLSGLLDKLKQALKDKVQETERWRQRTLELENKMADIIRDKDGELAELRSKLSSLELTQNKDSHQSSSGTNTGLPAAQEDTGSASENSVAKGKEHMTDHDDGFGHDAAAPFLSLDGDPIYANCLQYEDISESPLSSMIDPYLADHNPISHPQRSPSSPGTGASTTRASTYPAPEKEPSRSPYHRPLPSTHTPILQQTSIQPQSLHLFTPPPARSTASPTQDPVHVTPVGSPRVGPLSTPNKADPILSTPSNSPSIRLSPLIDDEPPKADPDAMWMSSNIAFPDPSRIDPRQPRIRKISVTPNRLKRYVSPLNAEERDHEVVIPDDLDAQSDGDHMSTI